MDSVKIEENAVRAVGDFVDRCARLKSSFSNNDKGPEWDGCIYLYKNANAFCNKNLEGRVPIQIKGKSVSRLKEKISYPIKIVSLRNYLKDGGVLFFVVQLCKEEKRICCKFLEPVRIKNILRNTKENKRTISLDIEAIPTSCSEFEELVFDFKFNCIKQSSGNNIAFSEAMKNGIRQYSTRVKIDKCAIPFLELSKKELFLYAQPPSSLESLIPIDDLHKLTFQRSIDIEISVDDELFFTQCVEKFENGEYVLIVANSLTLIFSEKIKNNKKQIDLKCSYKFTAVKLGDCIKEAKFLLALFKKKEIVLNGYKLSLALDKIPYSIEELNSKILIWEHWKCALDKLHLNRDVILSDINDDSARILDLLYLSKFKNKLVTLDGLKNENSIVCFDIANISIFMLAKWHQDKQQYELVDYFDSDNEVVYFDENKGKHFATVYSYLRKDGFVKCDNIPYSKIIPAYDFLKEVDSEIYVRACCDLLEILKAVDCIYNDDEKKNMLLHVSLDMAKWLLNNDSTKENILNYKINQFQIICRQRQLTLEEKSELVELEDIAETVQKAAINLLLGDKARFELQFSKLSEKEKHDFLSMPIAHFLTSNNI